MELPYLTFKFNMLILKLMFKIIMCYLFDLYLLPDFNCLQILTFYV